MLNDENVPRFIRIVENRELVNAQDRGGVVCIPRALGHHPNERLYKLTVTSCFPILSLGVAGKARGKRTGNAAMAEDGLLRIGELAKRTGTTLRTIRYYEQLGLINHSARTKGGFHLS